MRCPPYLVSLRVEEMGHTKIRLWLPVFILWPLLVALLLVAAVIAMLADLVTAVSGKRPGYTRLLFGCLSVAGEARGTEIFVQDKKKQTVAFTVR